jgi:hypothetical protein
MPYRPLNEDFDHWYDKAEEARAIAGQLSDTRCKEIMLRIAKDYEDLGRFAEARINRVTRRKAIIVGS